MFIFSQNARQYQHSDIIKSQMNEEINLFNISTMFNIQSLFRHFSTVVKYHLYQWLRITLQQTQLRNHLCCFNCYVNQMDYNAFKNLAVEFSQNGSVSDLRSFCLISFYVYYLFSVQQRQQNFIKHSQNHTRLIHISSKKNAKSKSVHPFLCYDSTARYTEIHLQILKKIIKILKCLKVG